MIDMTHRPHIHMGLVPLELLLRHGPDLSCVLWDSEELVVGGLQTRVTDR